MSDDFDLPLDGASEILVSAEVMEWITELEALQTAGLSADEIAQNSQRPFSR
jgi:hypothetical protein